MSVSRWRTLPSRPSFSATGVLFEDIEVVDTSIAPTVGNEDRYVWLKLRVAEDVSESSAFGPCSRSPPVSPRCRTARWLR